MKSARKLPIKDAMSQDLSIQWVPVDTIKPYERNARVIPQSAIDVVARSIQQFGFRQPIVVDRHMVIIAGHTRLLAAKQLGLDRVPVHVAENLTDEQVRAYRIMDNRSNQETSWDYDLLKEEMKSILESVEYDDRLLSSLTGFTDDEISAIISETHQDDITASPASAGSFTPLPPPGTKPKTITCPHCGNEIPLSDA